MTRRDPTLVRTVLGLVRLDLLVAALEAGALLRPDGPHAWAVSASDPVRGWHRVTRDPGDLYYCCDCEAASHELDCRHIALVTVVEATAVVPAIHPARSVS